MERPSMQTRVMKMAHIYARMGRNKSNALRWAWHIHAVRKAMREGIVCFQFIKTNGEVRMATGTLHPLLIPKDKAPKGTVEREPNYSSVAFFDLEKQDWRAFRVADFQYVHDAYLLKEITLIK